MAFKFVILCAALSAVNGGIIGEPASFSYAAPAITSQSSNILRSPGNLAQISTYSKTIDTPFSSVSKSDVRVSNPGVYSTVSYAAPALSYAAPAAPLYAKAAYAAPALSYAASAPIYAKAAYAAPALSYAASAPIYAKAAYAAPALSYAAPAAPLYAKAAYAAPAYGYAAAPAPLLAKAYAAPYATYAHGAPTVAAPGPVVAHTTFDGFGAHYAF